MKMEKKILEKVVFKTMNYMFFLSSCAAILLYSATAAIHFAGDEPIVHHLNTENIVQLEVEAEVEPEPEPKPIVQLEVEAELEPEPEPKPIVQLEAENEAELEPEHLWKEEVRSTTDKSSNTQFTDGLDDFNDLLGSIDAPDDLDISEGSSIQEILVVQSSKIIYTKVQRSIMQFLHKFQLQIEKKLTACNSRFKKMSSSKFRIFSKT